MWELRFIALVSAQHCKLQLLIAFFVKLVIHLDTISCFQVAGLFLCFDSFTYYSSVACEWFCM